jgi:hypothetical protein
MKKTYSTEMLLNKVNKYSDLTEKFLLKEGSGHLFGAMIAGIISNKIIDFFEKTDIMSLIGGKARSANWLGAASIGGAALSGPLMPLLLPIALITSMTASDQVGVIDYLNTIMKSEKDAIEKSGGATIINDYIGNLGMIYNSFQFIASNLNDWKLKETVKSDSDVKNLISNLDIFFKASEEIINTTSHVSTILNGLRSTGVWNSITETARDLVQSLIPADALNSTLQWALKKLPILAEQLNLARGILEPTRKSLIAGLANKPEQIAQAPAAQKEIPATSIAKLEGLGDSDLTWG